MPWNFQSVECMDKHVEEDDGKKVGVEKQYSKGFEFQNEWACLDKHVEQDDGKQSRGREAVFQRIWISKRMSMPAA